MKKTLFILCLCFVKQSLSYGFQKDSNLNTELNSITKPNILSTHPFGVFFNRLEGNFRTGVPTSFQIAININSGNVWGTPIDVYIPKDETIRNDVRTYEWHQAQYFFDEESLDAEKFSLQIDGVIKTFKLEGRLALNKKSEFLIATRLFMLTNGKTPFTLLTSDDFIESFHKNIAGGEDPFDRKVFGLNKALIEYNDINGNYMKLENNDLVFSGVELSYYYYPDTWLFHFLRGNIGLHSGINLSKYNSSLDFGLTVNNSYSYQLKDNASINIGFSLGTLRKELIELQKNNLEFGSNNFIGNLETLVEYKWISKHLKIHAIGTSYYFQTSLNKREELDYSILTRHPEAHNSWGHGVTNLYKTNNYWSLYYSFGRKVIKSFYIQQDLQVNNNPDIQTGFKISFFTK